MCYMQACDIFRKRSERMAKIISKCAYYSYSIICCMFYTKCHTIGGGRLTAHFPIFVVVGETLSRSHACKHSLRSWRDFVRECFCFGSEAVNASGKAVRRLVKSRVEFPPAQISGVF